MDAVLNKFYDLKIERTVKNLKLHNFLVDVCETKEDALKLIDSLIPANSVVSFGGSQSLAQIGAINLLRSGKYNLLDRTNPSLTLEEKGKVEREAFSADYYLASSNAVTEDGKLYNVDGYNNRVAAMLFGPKKVILVVGYNKIVKNIEEARTRMEEIAAPANCIRLNLPNPCVKTGHCMHCNLPTKICNGEVSIVFQRDPERIRVIIVKEELGY